MASNIQKYIKNESVSTITVEGQEILTGAYYLIQATEEAKFGSSSALLSYIGDGTVKMAKTNDGNNDISNVNEGINFLKQLLNPEVIISENQTPLPIEYPIDPSKMTIDVGTSALALLASGGGNTEVYTYTGSGKLHGFTLIFNSNRVQVTLEIDGYSIFNVDCRELETVAGNSKDSSWVFWHKTDNKLEFYPKRHITIASSISIKAEANSASTNRDLEGYIVQIEKDI